MALSVTPLTSAQEVLVDEDFEGGAVPADWGMFATIPVIWRISQAGDCGMPSAMAAYNHVSSCGYLSSFSTAGMLATPELEFPPDRDLRIEFDYAMEIDLGRDSVQLRLDEDLLGVPGLVIADEFDLQNDGVLHHVSFVVTDVTDTVGSVASVVFWISGDAIDNQGLGLMFDNVRVTLEPVGLPVCFGDGSGATCPCLNQGGPGEGCANSSGVGAILETSGSATVGADDLRLIATQARANTTGMFIQGSSQIAAPFRDGILCTGNPTERLEVAFLDAGGGAQSMGSIVSEGSVAPGDTRVYQLWYRDPSLSPCGTGSNLSSAQRVQWN